MTVRAVAIRATSVLLASVVVASTLSCSGPRPAPSEPSTSPSVPPSTPTPERTDPGPASSRPDPDYNGDGFADLVVAGADLLQVIYGSAAGLQRSGTRTLRRSELTAAPPAPHWNGDDEVWGSPSVASGDFDGDGFCDLAIGEFWGAVDGLDEAGAVHIVFGSAAGLSPTRTQYWTQNSPGLLDQAEEHESFGASLAAGDLGGGPEADLAIGVTEAIGKADDAGAVHVLYGSAGGLRADGNQLWSQDSPGIAERAEGPDQFGRSLAIADFDGSGVEDLAVGAPFEEIDHEQSDGVVHVIYGSEAGLTSAGNQLWTWAGAGGRTRGPVELQFGYDLAAGHLAGTPYADLAVAGFETVSLIYGTADGLAARGSRSWDESAPELAGLSRMGRFEDTITVADFGRNRGGRAFDDLVITTSGESKQRLLNEKRYGGVLVLYGGPGGIAGTDRQFWSQRSFGVGGVNEDGDGFGWALAGADFGGPAASADLVIGSPTERLGRRDFAGRIHVLYGSDRGLTDEHVQVWDQGRLGGKITAQAEFGGGLSASDP